MYIVNRGGSIGTDNIYIDNTNVDNPRCWKKDKDNFYEMYTIK